LNRLFNKVKIKPKFWDYKGLTVWSILLLPLSIIFLFFSLISKNYKKKNKFSIPVICVGNIYIGGTGKTPLVKEIFKIIKSVGKNPAFIKKDYDYLVDEIKMLKKTGKTFTNKSRLIAINSSIFNNHNVAILDDGYQDFEIYKDLSILCFNSNQLIGNGFIIPSGPLREKFNSIKRADCIVINGNRNIEFEKKINASAGSKNIPIFYSKYKIKNIEKFHNKSIIAFAGIGNPINFFNLLRENNFNLKKTYSFPDHYNYTQKDFDKIIGNNNLKIITTEKDFNRINESQKKNCDYVEVSLEIKNAEKFKNFILSYI